VKGRTPRRIREKTAIGNRKTAREGRRDELLQKVSTRAIK
jgi:hypothetical protein